MRSWDTAIAWPEFYWPALFVAMLSEYNQLPWNFTITLSCNHYERSLFKHNSQKIGTAIFSVDAPEKSSNAGAANGHEEERPKHYAATGSKPLCLRSGSGEGSRPRNETNTCSQWLALVLLPATKRTQNKIVFQIIWRLHSLQIDHHSTVSMLQSNRRDYKPLPQAETFHLQAQEQCL